LPKVARFPQPHREAAVEQVVAQAVALRAGRHRIEGAGCRFAASRTFSEDVLIAASSRSISAGLAGGEHCQNAMRRNVSLWGATAASITIPAL
jgi:hypothetical protein